MKLTGDGRILKRYVTAIRRTLRNVRCISSKTVDFVSATKSKQIIFDISLSKSSTFYCTEIKKTYETAAKKIQIHFLLFLEASVRTS